MIGTRFSLIMASLSLLLLTFQNCSSSKSSAIDIETPTPSVTDRQEQPAEVEEKEAMPAGLYMLGTECKQIKYFKESLIDFKHSSLQAEYLININQKSYATRDSSRSSREMNLNFGDNVIAQKINPSSFNSFKFKCENADRNNPEELYQLHISLDTYHINTINVTKGYGAPYDAVVTGEKFDCVKTTTNNVVSYEAKISKFNENIQIKEMPKTSDREVMQNSIVNFCHGSEENKNNTKLVTEGKYFNIDRCRDFEGTNGRVNEDIDLMNFVYTLDSDKKVHYNNNEILLGQFNKSYGALNMETLPEGRAILADVLKDSDMTCTQSTKITNPTYNDNFEIIGGKLIKSYTASTPFQLMINQFVTIYMHYESLRCTDGKIEKTLFQRHRNSFIMLMKFTNIEDREQSMVEAYNFCKKAGIKLNDNVIDNNYGRYQLSDEN